MNRKIALLLAVLTFALTALYSQESSDENGDAALYVIEDFEFDVKGRSRPDAIIRSIELKKGEQIRGMANLERYIQDKTQMLINQRILKDNAEIDYAIGEKRPDGSSPVTLLIKVEDSWNIIALPRPKYSTNTGFELVIKARDYNFLGTMIPLRIDLGYFYNENHKNSFSFEIDSSMPFKAFGYDWNFSFINLFEYRPEVDEPFYFKNITGLSMELPFYRTTFTFGFEESLNLNEENSSRDQLATGKEFQTGVYMSTKLFTSWKIPTGLEVFQFGELTYTPEISATFNHELNSPLQDVRQGPFMRFQHTLGFEKVDWHANYREGLSVSANNSFIYDFFRKENNDEPLSITFTINGTGHYIVSDFFAVSSRLMYRHWFYHDPPFNDQAADAIRGIADKAIDADYMLSLNMDFPFRVLLFMPSDWFKNRKLRFFDFELQISPVVDLSLYHNPEKPSFSAENFTASGGLEFIAFPFFMRNLFIRLCFAYNLKEFINSRPLRLPGGENYEIVFTLGHHY